MPEVVGADPTRTPDAVPCRSAAASWSTRVAGMTAAGGADRPAVPVAARAPHRPGRRRCRHARERVGRATVRTAVTIPRRGRGDRLRRVHRTLTARADRDAVRDSTTVDIELGPGGRVGAGRRRAVRVGGLTVAARSRASATPTSSRRPGRSSPRRRPGVSRRSPPWRELDDFVPLSDPDLLPRFSGTARYTRVLRLSSRRRPAPSSTSARSSSSPTVRLNGVDLGTRIAPPYRVRRAGRRPRRRATRSRSRSPTRSPRRSPTSSPRSRSRIRPACSAR